MPQFCNVPKEKLKAFWKIHTYNYVTLSFPYSRFCIIFSPYIDISLHVVTDEIIVFALQRKATNTVYS